MSFTATTPNSAAAWRPDQFTFAPSDVVPQALVLQCSTVAGSVEGDAPSVRCAFVVDDQAGFTAEADPIDEAHPQLAEAVVFTGKITQLVRLSREQYQQTGTAEQVSRSVSRAVVRRADTAFLAEPSPSPALAPAAGVLNWPGIVTGDVVSDSLDSLIDLVATLEDNLAQPTHIVLDPKGWGAFRKLKVGSAYNQSLLGAGTSDAVERLLSLPVLVNVGMSDYTGLVIDASAIVSAVGPVQIATSEHEYFSADQVLVRACWRIGHSVARPERIGRFLISGGGS